MKAFDAILDLLYPPDVTCALCGKEALTSGGICHGCASTLKSTGYFEPPPGCSAAWAAHPYEPPVSECIHRFKYENQRHLAHFLAGCISIPEEWGIEALLSVPLHKKRERERGYNQSALICKALEKRTGITVISDLLVRQRYTRPQIELSHDERHGNVNGAFALTGKIGLGRVALVDDVITTGSTMGECARTLKEGGVTEVFCVCVCHAAPKK